MMMKSLQQSKRKHQLKLKITNVHMGFALELIVRLTQNVMIAKFFLIATELQKS